MKQGLIRFAFVTTICSGLAGVGLGAQGAAQAPPAGPNNGVQVAVPQGNAAAAGAGRRAAAPAQTARNRLANQPAPRTADGHIVIGNTATAERCLDRQQPRILQRQHRGRRRRR